MAKLGEGDDRWIVKERDDGKNCKNWHWSETNLTEWSKDRLTELLVGIVAMDEGSASGWCKTTALEKCTGDVTVQSRKQKKFPLYELELKIKWEGQLWDAQARQPLCRLRRLRSLACAACSAVWHARGSRAPERLRPAATRRRAEAAAAAALAGQGLGRGSWSHQDPRPE